MNTLPQRLSIISCLLLFYLTSSAQTAIFDEFPANYRLYGRQSNNFGMVPVSGRIQESGYRYVSLVKLRNNSLYGHQKEALSYQNGAAQFSFLDSIKAELAEYAFIAYAHRTEKDSVEIARSTNNVAGDFYIVYGQSNAVNWEVDYEYRNEYCRSYGFSWENNGDGWGLSNSVSPRVGIFSITFQSEIARRHGIPTCMITGAMAGASIFDLSGRNPDNPSDPTNAYGALLSRAYATGLHPFIKGIFYWQGESEASSDSPHRWLPQFEILLENLQKDYPSVEKIYVFQLPLFGGGTYDDRIGEFREQQRLLGVNHPIVQVYAPGGATGWDGFHYFLEGSIEVGNELADMAGYLHYGKKERISSPDFQKAFYSNKEQSEITIVFDDHQTMVWPKDSTYANIESSQEPFSTYRMVDFFYLNKEWQKLKAGRAEANKVIVTLKEVGNDTLIKYLPSKYHYSPLPNAPWVYLGPFLKNTHGFRAMAFHHNPIAPYTDLGIISLDGRENGPGIDLSWNKLTAVSGYKLERLSSDDTDDPHKIWHFDESIDHFTDYTALQGHNYRYRVRGYTEDNESEISEEITLTKTIENIVLGNESRSIENNLMVFPNPVKDVINIEAESGLIHKAELLSIDGRTVVMKKLDQTKAEIVISSIIPSGVYFLKIWTKNSVIVKRIVK